MVENIKAKHFLVSLINIALVSSTGEVVAFRCENGKPFDVSWNASSRKASKM